MIPSPSDDPCSTQPLYATRATREYQRYYAEVPAGSFDEQSRLIEQVINFALDTLGVRHLDVRVRSTEQVGAR
jgi:hypothetical protein